jgi:hypothetical protein
VAESGYGFTRIMVAIMIEKDDPAAQFSLQPPGGLDFRKEKAPWKKAARLLAEADDGGGVHSTMPVTSRDGPSMA